MSENKNGWSDWDQQIIRKTERRHKAAYRTSRRRARTAALLVELGLFLLILALMALESAGLIAGVVAMPLIVIAICCMCFCGGYVAGNKYF